MRNAFSLARYLAQGLVISCLAIVCAAQAFGGMVADSKKVAKAENVFADFNDASSIKATIDSGFVNSYRGKDRATWDRVLRKKRKELGKDLAKLPSSGLSENDSKAVAAMRMQFKASSENSSAIHGPNRRCEEARGKDLDYASLRAALVACFVEIGNNLSFEGATINRVSGLDLLHRTEEPERRKAVFLAFVPLWRAINGNNESDSPYRRLMALAASDAAKHGSEVDAAARDAGVESSQVEHWLEQILDAWREVSGDQMTDPWDFRYQAGKADRLLAAAVPHDSLLPINQHYYQDLGADLKQLGVLYDIDPRPGKAVAYTDFVTHGRMSAGVWQPTIARVSASYKQGGLGVLNELVHENGHVMNLTAIRNRPAFVDWPGDLFAEAFADVPSWSTYEPAWQRRYLGREAPEKDSLRALYANVVLGVAWALFEVRMLSAPATDPNALWSEITSHYLHIVPHPEFSWWAVRVQLADSPGYMVNYGFGAVLTADMRQHIREALGPFDSGDPRWYAWVSERLLRYGSERDSRTMLLDFLGRPVSPQALLDQIHRIRAAGD